MGALSADRQFWASIKSVKLNLDSFLQKEENFLHQSHSSNIAAAVSKKNNI